MRKTSIVFAVTALLAGCVADDARVEATRAQRLELDDVDQPPQGISLVVLDSTADAGRFAEVVGKLQGAVLHTVGPRLLAARLPPRADAILTSLGMRARYERAVDPSEIPGASIEEQRFVRVFDARYYAGPGAPEIPRLRAPRVAGAPLEGAPGIAPRAAAPEGPDRETTPFASGAVVVSILLPESNGVAEPSTEDWTEDAILETYAKIQAALEAIARTEPNADLRFVLHYESAPGHGGLPGTIDSDWELVRHADFTDGAGEAMVSAPMLARLLGHDVTPDQQWEASYEYLNRLRDRYHADGAFYVKVANNRHFTAGLRAHAYINGPWTTLSTDYGFETFMHEFGHVFGALDEYCPDACVSPTALQGYLGIANANATFRPGGDGVNGGQGEDMPSLMTFNMPMGVNGYTRGAWGWLDTDGDGIVDVRDTTPKSALAAAAFGQRVRLRGTITDVGATRVWGEPRSINRIVGVDVRAADRDGAPWIRVPVDAPTVRGTATVDLDLGDYPCGARAIDVRAVSSVGNVEIAPQRIAFDVVGDANTAPRVQLAATPEIGSTRSTFTLDARAIDLDDGDRVALRFDVDGDGRFDTSFGAATQATARFATPGLHTAIVEARDLHGATARASVPLYVEDGNAPPRVTLAPLPSLAHGSDLFDADLRVASASDPDGDPIEYDWTAELATTDQTYRVETGFSAANTTFPVALRTPKSLLTTQVDLAAGQALTKGTLTKVIPLRPNLLAAADGVAGLLVTDVTDPSAPRAVAHLDLETEATGMTLDGDRLYVTGPSLFTIVDVSDPQRPVEKKQRAPFQATRTIDAPWAISIPDGDGEPAMHFLWASFGERIGDVTVSLVIDHPAPEELTMALSGPDRQEIILRDRVAGPGGSQTYTFDAKSTPALASLAGAIASGPWTVVVRDGAPRNAGTLVSSTVTFHTSSRAEPMTAGGQLLGVVGGRYVVVAGEGVEVHDAQNATNVRVVATVPSTGCFGGGVVGSTAMVLAPLETKPPKDPTAARDGAVKPQPTARGLFALDLRNPRRPVVRRADTTYATGGQLFVAGTRFYLAPNPADRGDGARPAPFTPYTVVGSVARFAAGGDYALGTMPLVLHDAYGDDRSLVALSEQSNVERVDVSDPSRARVVASFFRPWSSSLAPIDANHVVLYDWGAPIVRIADLRDARSITSRVYRVTLQARDRDGVTTASRALHVIPYDHPPTIDGVEIAASSDDPDLTVTLRASDPDRASWDPTLLARADLDGDGIFDGTWTTMTAGQPTTFRVPFAASGARTVRFEVRDGFFASTSQAITVERSSTSRVSLRR